MGAARNWLFAWGMGMGMGMSMAMAWSAQAARSADDPLNSPACLQALARLEAAEVARAPAPDDLSAARSHAARQCLRERLDRPAAAERRTPMPLPPERVLPALSRSGLPPPSPLTEVGPTATRRSLTSITQCDAAGCWASDGSRLQRLGPDLVGPKGVCSVQGSVLLCPP
jgi:hypothetical protein